jgi:hypothetical protein
LQIADLRLQIEKRRSLARFSICNLKSAICNVFLLAPLLSISAAPPEKVTPAERQENISRVKTGMTAAEASKLLGAADVTSRQILYRRYVEQWSYDSPQGLWIELDCVKGQHPRVVAVHLPVRDD